MHTADRTNGRGPGPEYVYAKCEQAIIVETEVKIVFNYGYRVVVKKAASEVGRLMRVANRVPKCDFCDFSLLIGSKFLALTSGILQNI